MDSDWAYASFILRVELSLILGEVVEDGVGDTRGKDDGVSVQCECVISLEAVMTIEAV